MYKETASSILIPCKDDFRELPASPAQPSRWGQQLLDVLRARREAAQERAARGRAFVRGLRRCQAKRRRGFGEKAHRVGGWALRGVAGVHGVWGWTQAELRWV